MYQQIMALFLSKYSSKNVLTFTFIALVSVFLSACVTQEYKADNTPIIVNPVKKDEIAMTRIQLGLGYLKMGNTTQAKLNLEKAKRIAPNLVQVYTAFAHYYDEVGEVDLAINAYKKALAIKNDDADTLNNYGVFLCSQNKIEESEKQLLKAIAVPSYLLVSQSYENIALCQLKVNHFDKAEKYLKKSIEHNPNNVSALVQMAQLQYAKKAYLKAEQYVKRFEKVTRHFSPIPLALAYKVYRKQGKNKVAKNYASMLVKMFPRSYQSKQYLHNGLAHIEADDLADKYHQRLLLNQPINVKKRVFKLSPNHQRKLVTTTYQAPFKVKSELNRLPISRSVKPEKSIDKNESTTTENENVISDEMMNALINETVVSTVSKGNSKANSQIDNETADKMINKIVSTDVATDISTNDSNDNVSKNSTEQKVDNIVNDDIVSDVATNNNNDNVSENGTEKKVDTIVNDDIVSDVATNDSNDNVSNNSTEQKVDTIVNDDIVSDVATNDSNDNVSKNSTEQKIDTIVNDDLFSDVATNDSNDNVSKNNTEQKIDTIVNDDVTTDTTSNDATDKAIDEAINKLIAGDVNKDTTNKKVSEKNSTDKSSEPLIHIIRKDQNLFYISRTYNIRLSALRRWNHLTKSSVLQVGDVIHLIDPVIVKDSNKVQPYND